MLPQMTYCKTCDGNGGVETLHPAYGTRSCPEAYVLVHCETCDGSGTRKLNDHLLDVLAEVEDFLDNQADAEIDENGRTIGNEAMKLLVEVKDAIARLEGK